MSLESKLQDISSEIQKIQVTMSKAVTAREKLEAQLQENELVKKVNSRVGSRQSYLGSQSPPPHQEFANLTEDNTVYKLLGPVLVEQDQAEARSTVDTRLDFIRSEM
jgi:prefoldin beta subunit